MVAVGFGTCIDFAHGVFLECSQVFVADEFSLTDGSVCKNAMPLVGAF